MPHQAHMRRNQTASGRAGAFTLVEMLVVLGILGVLLGATVPFLVSFMRLSDLDQAVSTVKMAALRARSVSVERGQPCDLVFAPSITGYDAEGLPERANEQADLLWLRLVRFDGARRASMRRVMAGEPRYLPQNCRLVLGTFGNVLPHRPQERYVTFLSTGALSGGTDPRGLYVLGPPEYQGRIQQVSAAGDELTVGGDPWAGLENAFRNYYVVVFYDPDEIAGENRRITGQARLIESNTAKSLTLQEELDPDAGGDHTAYGNLPFAIVTPDNIQNVHFYATTGQVKAGPPREEPE